MLAEFWTGKETAFGKSVGFHALYIPPAGSNTRETHLNVAAGKTDKVVTIRKPVQHSAYPGKIDDFGLWYNAAYDLKEGTVICLVGTRNEGYGNRNDTAKLFLKVRATGPHIRIRIKGTNCAGCRQSHYFIEGRFDRMTVDEVLAHTGLPQLPLWDRTATADHVVARTLEVIEIGGELAPKAVPQIVDIKSAAGEVKKVAAPVRQRIVKI